MQPAARGDVWVGLVDGPLPLDEASRWVVRPDCGAVVVFSGTSRDHSEHRHGVVMLTYEAYESQVDSRLEAIVEEARRRWPDLGRFALLHRVGEVPVGESSVVVAVSAPHREEAFAAARFGIDTLKATVPIWKREDWEGGSDWAMQSQPISELGGEP